MKQFTTKLNETFYVMFDNTIHCIINKTILLCPIWQYNNHNLQIIMIKNPFIIIMNSNA